ncbi:F0F1 ATP synthase subunit epsilon [Mycoplasma sp. U97]|uniref:F0F1 ATP synthase subunit epsilon n=2 Tax=Mycoplasma tauri TaxID=547987 RepID=UPI001CBBEF06|nr:ATP synthase delta/epsilon chain alpha-helix domain-containing protein [Mycoplasma tauri]MBZ4204451.1 F0F1 ATP synthase subunit epsilon [Mycoplasma tauri]MBZ4212449.1 F0F1 ATP synthase subunit epsilon [Mycoplasma tauri]MBZ4226923.1 F0F1 ATP synthase subunit epsilon [Mycoplasma tauri]
MWKYSNLKIVTHAKVFYEGPVLSVQLKTKSGGQIVLQPNRSEFLSTIDIGKLIINPFGENLETKVCSISDGIVYADESNIHIITNDIIFSDLIDINRAEKERIETIERIKNTTDVEMLQHLEIKLKRSINRIDISNQYN